MSDTKLKSLSKEDFYKKVDVNYNNFKLWVLGIFEKRSIYVYLRLAFRLSLWVIVRVKKFIVDRSGFIYPVWIISSTAGVLAFIDLKNLWPGNWYPTILGGLSIIKTPGDLILFWTFLGILIYSVETYRLRDETYKMSVVSEKTRREMILANQISIQPALVLEYKEGGPPWFFSLKNIGRGSAINIGIATNNREFSFKLSGLNVMKDSDEKQVILLRNGNNLNNEDWSFLAENPIRAVIYFERTKKIKGRRAVLKTEIEINNPPNTKIEERQWIPA